MATNSVTKVYNEELHIPPTHTNQFSLTDRTLSPNSNLGGWYYGESFFFSIFYITDHIEFISVDTYSWTSTGKPNYLARQFPIIANFIFTRQGNIFVSSAPSGSFQYIYDPNQEAYIANLEDLNTVAQLSTNTFAVKMQKWKNPDERMWRYNLKLHDPSTIYNSFQKFYKFASDFYTAGRVSGFAVGGDPEPILGINPYGVDYSQIMRSFGGKTRYEYEAIVKKLWIEGIPREYNVKRLVYWPEPGSADDLTPAERDAITWFVNQQRYNFLAFVVNFPEEGKDNFALLCPGNRIHLLNSGTRFDNFPLKLAMDGWHTGPKPPREFVNPNFYDNWSFFSIRIPLLITQNNNRICYQDPDDPTTLSVIVPVGDWYFEDLIDWFNDNTPFFFAIGSSSNRLNIFANPGTIVFSPDNPDCSSTFFGPLGLRVGYLFPTPTIVTPANGRFLLTPPSTNPNSTYNTFTPLTTEEIRSFLTNLNVIRIGSQHGPVTNDMAPDDFSACILELSTAMSTEVHTVIYPWTRKTDSGLDTLYTDRQRLFNDLDASELTYEFTYTPSDPVNEEAEVPPGLRTQGIRINGVGHPGGFSEMYKTGQYRSAVEELVRSIARIEWLFPQDLYYYPSGTIVNFGGVDYDLSGREFEIPAVNYIEDPRWLISLAGPGNVPTIEFIPYVDYESVYSTNPNRATNPNIIDGEWLVGVFRDNKVRQALGRGPSDPVPKIGYLTYYFSAASLAGNPTTQPWYEPNGGPANQIGTFIAAKILEYYNIHQVQHIIFDIRNTVGGNNPVITALAEHIGASRTYNYDPPISTITKQQLFDDTGFEVYYDQTAMQKYAEDRGAISYKYIPTIRAADPDALLSVFTEQELFRGPPPTIMPGLSTQRNLVWFTNETTISSTQDVYLIMKGTSLTQAYDGDFGGNVQFIGYGVYDRPFSTSGNYTSFLDWYSRDRESREEVKIPPMYSIDRLEATNSIWYDGSIVKSGGQSFERLHQPNIKWNMNADIFYQDIGYTLDNSVPPQYGQPWTHKRYNDVIFTNSLTWRDSFLERAIQMAVDPNVKSHFFVDDGYGYVPPL